MAPAADCDKRCIALVENMIVALSKTVCTSHTERRPILRTALHPFLYSRSSFLSFFGFIVFFSSFFF